MKGSPRPYVVKLYKTIDIEARNKMTAEVLGNVLAREFGLNVPDAAIINFSDDFRMHLNAECEELLSVLDDRPNCCPSIYATEKYKYILQTKTFKLVNQSKLEKKSYE